jgi:hypothetical protein
MPNAKEGLGVVGEPCATRTRDTLLKRQVLCHAELTAHDFSIPQPRAGVKSTLARGAFQSWRDSLFGSL